MCLRIISATFYGINVIVGIKQDGVAQQYGYRAGQLSQADTVTGNYEYQYDVTGNRTAATAIGSEDDHASILDYAPVARGNRLESARDALTGEQVSYQYNDAGSPIAVGELVYEYNARQRPITVSRGGDLVAEYRYNNFGERIKKITYSQHQKKVTHYLYDNQQLVAEIDGDTLEYRQTVYLKHTPVVHLIGKTAYGVHTDHLGTPKLLTNDEGETVWKASHTPLGLAVIETDTIEFNLRFPGHYADNETGTHYNYQRDYDPRTGRYLTSDPVGLEGGDNTYAYVDNNVLGAFDALGLAGQLLGGEASSSSSAQPFTLRSSGSAVENPSTLPDDVDVADLGITDPNQLVTEFLAIGSFCESDRAVGFFNEGIDVIIAYDVDNTGLKHILVGSELDNVIEAANRPSTNYQATNVAAASLASFEGFDDSSLLLIPHCADDEKVRSIIAGTLGSNLHASEVQGIIDSLGEPVENPDDPGGKLCRNARIVDVTELHEELLQRFQVRLATDPRVVDAERNLILAQEALANYLRLNPDDAICNRERGGGSTTICQLTIAVENAAERYATVLSDMYDEQVNNNLLPPYDDNAAKAAARQQIMLGVIGIFIPLTATDVAIDAGLIAAGGFGKVAKMFEGAVDLFRKLKNGVRGGIDEIIAKGSEAARRADAIKMQAYPDLSNMQNFNYADVVRMEHTLGPDKLAKLNGELGSSPALTAAFKNDPDLADAWKAIDDIGACSFDGSTTVVTELGLKPIEALVAGSDRVLARDERTGAQEFKDILAKYSNQYSKKVIIRSTNNLTNEQVSVVSNKIHPIFVRSSGGLLRVSSEGHAYLGDQEHGEWVDASELRVGDLLKNDNGTWSTIKSVEIIAEEFTAYNLTVEDFNTYFVSEQGKSSSFWVHNTCINIIKKDPVALAQMNRLATNNNLGLSESDIAALIAKPSTKGLQWDNPKKVLEALERSSRADIPGLEISHAKFSAPANGDPSYILPNAKKYQEEASGDAGLSFILTRPNGKTVSFDNIDESGALIDRKWGHGPSIFKREVGADGVERVVAHNSNRAQSIIEQARRQIDAAGGAPIKWEIETKLGAEGIEAIFEKEGIDIVVEWEKQLAIVVP